MKHFLLICCLCSFASYSQTGVTNLDFENWTGQTPNGFNITSGVSQQTATPQNGTKYVRVTSNGQSFPNVQGYMGLNGTGNNVLAGVPYAQLPTALTGYIRTNMVGVDTMYIVGHLRRNYSTIVASFNYSVTQTISNWQQITIPINYLNGMTPDTVQMTVIANKGFMNMRPAGGNGTYMELDNFSFTLPTGIRETIQAGQWSLYPNPASGNLYVEAAGDFAGSMEVYDVCGKKAKETMITSGKNPVSLQGMPAGLYIYRIIGSNNDAVQTGRFVITD